MRKRIITVITIMIVAVSLFVALSGCSDRDTDDDLDVQKSFDELYPQPTKSLYSVDNVLYDQNDEHILLKGVNIGNWLVPEGWMGVIEIDGQNDNVDGEKLTYKKMISALKNNEHSFSDEQIKSLLDVYYRNWFTEADVEFIKQSGFNCIRLPFGYFNVADQNADILPDGFFWIDKCLEWCQKYGLYCILDLHGAYGSQNKEHHSGDDTQCILFEDETSQRLTAKLWRAVAERYKDNTVVAGYDLLNEPTGNTNQTVAAQHVVHDMLYRTIREVDSKHLIFIESCWQFTDFPDAEAMGWENVVYEMHNYDFSDDSAKYLSWHMFVYSTQKSLKKIPVLIGEYWLGVQDLELTVDTFNRAGFSWTFWTYKTNRAGAWGAKNLDTDRVNLSHSSYDEIVDAFNRIGSENATVSAEFTSLLDIMATLDQDNE